jgi:putative chitinase
MADNLADIITDQLNKYRAQPMGESRLLKESEKRKGVMSKISKMQRGVEDAMQSTTQDALESINSLMTLTRESRTLPEDKETPDLDYFLGEDIDEQEKLVNETGLFLKQAKESTQEVDIKDADEGTIISDDSSSAAEVQPDTDGKVELEFPKVFKGNQSNFESLQTKAIQKGFTGEELASFLAQTKHESDKFNSIVEKGSDTYFDRYEPGTDLAEKLGNTQKGDGKKFKGRGYIQITGRSNYKQVGDALGLDLLNNPELLETPENAAQASIWWWENNVRKRIPNKDFSDNYAVSGLVNRGSTKKRAAKLAEREVYYKQYMGLVPTESPYPKPRPTGIMSR